MAAGKAGWPVWTLIALALVEAVVGLSFAGGTITTALASTTPYLFAAAVLYVTPVDRKFAYGAILIAAYHALQLAMELVSGEWLFGLPVLASLRSGVALVDSFLLIAGVALVAMALGGVRSNLGWLIVGVGALAAAVGLWAVLTMPAQLPVAELVISMLGGAVYAPTWAFLLAAAYDARRRYFLVGSAILFAILLFDYLLLVVTPFGPTTDFGLVQLVWLALRALGWLALAVAVLYGEISGRAISERRPLD